MRENKFKVFLKYRLCCCENLNPRVIILHIEVVQPVISLQMHYSEPLIINKMGLNRATLEFSNGVSFRKPLQSASTPPTKFNPNTTSTPPLTSFLTAPPSSIMTTAISNMSELYFERQPYCNTIYIVFISINIISDIMG